MLWKLTDEQVAYVEALSGWLDSVADVGQVRAWLDVLDHTTFEKRFVADGLAGVGFGEELGGQGGGMVELALTAEQFGRAAVPSGAWLATVLAVPALAGDPARAAAALAGAPAVWCAPADQLLLQLKPAALDGDRVTGEVSHVLAAGQAEAFVVLVADRQGARSLRLVDARADGVRLEHVALLDRSRAAAHVRLDAATSLPLPVADLDGLLEEVSARSGVLAAADSLGSSQRMLDLAVEYSLQRHQFGVPIGSFQAVKHAAATVLVGVEAARSVVYYAAASIEGGHSQRLMHAAAAKAQVTAEGARAADSTLTMHGAIGFTWEHDLQLFYKRAKLDERLLGSPSVWNEVIAAGLALA